MPYVLMLEYFFESYLYLYINVTFKKMFTLKLSA